MRNYLPLGGGRNSVATLLLFLDEGIDFEAVYVWMPDLPETHDYIMMLENINIPITTLIPNSGRFWNIYDKCWTYKMMPGFKRWCTVDYKIKTLSRYYKKPCFDHVSFSTDEWKRAKYISCNGIEKRYPLLEREISLKKCIEIIKHHGLAVPPKSSCFFCPQQTPSQWRKLRRNHPDLYCKALALEKRCNRPLPLNGTWLEKFINEKDRFLFSELAYPPCQCGL